MLEQQHAEFSLSFWLLKCYTCILPTGLQEHETYIQLWHQHSRQHSNEVKQSNSILTDASDRRPLSWSLAMLDFWGCQWRTTDRSRPLQCVWFSKPTALYHQHRFAIDSISKNATLGCQYKKKQKMQAHLHTPHKLSNNIEKTTRLTK